MGNYLSYILTNVESCSTSQISKFNSAVDTKNLSMINLQNDRYEVVPQIFRFTE